MKLTSLSAAVAQSFCEAVAPDETDSVKFVSRPGRGMIKVAVPRWLNGSTTLSLLAAD